MRDKPLGTMHPKHDTTKQTIDKLVQRQLTIRMMEELMSQMAKDDRLGITGKEQQYQLRTRLGLKRVSRPKYREIVLFVPKAHTPSSSDISRSCLDTGGAKTSSTVRVLAYHCNFFLTKPTVFLV